MQEQQTTTSLMAISTESNDLSVQDILSIAGLDIGILEKNKSFNMSISQLREPEREIDKKDLLVKTIQGKYSILIENLKEYLQSKMIPQNSTDEAECEKYKLFKAIFCCGNSIITLLQSSEYSKKIIDEFVDAMLEKRIDTVKTLTFSDDDIKLSSIFELPQTPMQLTFAGNYIQKEYNSMFWNTVDSKYGDEKAKKYLFEIIKISFNYSVYSFYKTFQEFKDIKTLPSVSEFKEKLNFHFKIGNDMNSKMRLLIKIFEAK